MSHDDVQHDSNNPNEHLELIQKVSRPRPRPNMGKNPNPDRKAAQTLLSQKRADMGQVRADIG